MAKLKGYTTEKAFRGFRDRYKECIRMLNGLEKTLERKVSDRERRWQVAEESAEYSVNYKAHFAGWPIPSKTGT